MFLWLRWCLQVLKDGVHPSQNHDHQCWSPEFDKKRVQAAGTPLPFLGAVVQLRADWAEIAHTLSVPQWSSARHPCFLCDATRESVYRRLEECNWEGLPWNLTTAEDYETACQECEVRLPTPSSQTCEQLQRLLEHDMRKDGSRGLSLRVALPEWGLHVNDRLEPTEAEWDNQAVLQKDPAPDLLFWRRRCETKALHRNPLLSSSLGTDLASVVALDVMHTLCLGVHQQFAATAMWACIKERNVPGMPDLEAGRDEENMQFLKNHYNRWVRAAKKKFLVTAVGDLGLEMIGTNAQPFLKAKAHETLTLVRWLKDFLPTLADQMAVGEVWVRSATNLVSMWQKMSDAPMVVPEDTQQARGK